MSIEFIGMACALGLSAMGSAFGAGFAAQASVGAWKNADRPMARPAKMPVNMASAGSAPEATALRMKFISRKP